MLMWLDDIRKPWEYGYIGATWVKTAQEAIDLLKTGQVTKASLDHDLTEDHYPWNCTDIESCTGTGYDVVLFLERNPQLLPTKGLRCHSANPAGKARMDVVINKLLDRSDSD